MRILVLTHYALPHVGGIEAVVDATNRELRARGHSVVHVSSDAGPDAPGGSGDPAPRRVAAWNALERRLDVPYPLFSPRLLGVVRREVARADVVHAHGFLYLPSLAGLALARRGSPSGPSSGPRRSPARVLTEHVGHVDYEHPALDGLQRAAIATLGRLSARSADAIVALNERVAAEVRALAPRAEVRIIPNGVDTARFRPAERQERQELRAGLGWDERPRVLLVGRWVPKKGVELAVRAAAAAEGAFELVAVGPGQPEHPLPHVRLLGARAPSEVAQLYRAADALLLPSHGEGFPVSVQEALASGLPAFLRDDPVYRPHAARAGQAVRLLPPDAERITRALLSFLGGERREARRQAREYAVETFSLRRSVDRLEAVYERVHGARHP